MDMVSLKSFTVALLIVCAIDTHLYSREFTDVQGRKIEATIVSYIGENIELKMGSRTFAVPIAKFSEADQKYIREWIEANQAKAGYIFRFFADLDEDFQGRKTSDGVLIDDRVKTRPHNYSMIVYNKTPATVSGVTVKYEIYVNDVVDTRGNAYAKMGLGHDKVDRLQSIAGEITDVEIAPEGRFDFEHNFDLHNYVDRDGGRTDAFANDKVIGVIIRVYSGDQMIKDFVHSEDSARMENVSWQDERPEKKIKFGEEQPE